MSTWKPKQSPYFQYDFVLKGRRYTGSTKQRTKAKADRSEERIRDEVKCGDKKRPPITLDMAGGLYRAKVQELASWPTARYIIEALMDGLDEARLLSEISQIDLMAFFAKRRDGRSNASVNREIETCRALWRWAAKARFDVGEMPDWGALMLKVSSKPPRELAIEEEDALIREIRADLVDFCMFALKTGWRRAEVLGLRWSDVDINAALATITIKGGDMVRRPLTQEMVITIANQPKVGPFVFTYVCAQSKSAYVDKLGRKQPARRKGERYPMTATVLRKPWAEAKKAAKVENFRFHDLRHTRGTRILRATGNLAATKAALAHRNIKTTLRYAHVLDEDVRNALDASDLRTFPNQHFPERRRRLDELLSKDE